MAWKLTCYALTVILTYYLATLIQTALHALLGHRTVGGFLYTTHVYCHHALYSNGRMVSDKYLPEEKDAAPFFIVPVALVGWAAYELLPFDVFLVHAGSISLCFFAHLYLHKHYHLSKSWLDRFRWFRTRQQLHFVHHRHASKNYALIESFWDKVFGTHQSAENESK